MSILLPHQLTLLGEEQDTFSIDSYQQLASLTDQTKGRGYNVILMGLFGEVGSLLSELKKKIRDADSYVRYADSVVEELGDVLWYLSNLASRWTIPLSLIVRRAMAVKESDWLGLMADPHLGFTDVQEANIVGIGRSPETYEKDALGLAIEIGKALEAYTRGEFESNPDSLVAILVNIFRHLLRLADHARISLKKAAYLNLKKVSSRWPMEKRFPERFDAALDEYERFPDQIQIDFIERNVSGKCYVFQEFFGLTIGDRLSDNRREPDGYSFHDVFHLSYAAILCWSPVLRALLKLKRKSKPEIDEAEDGARAIIIEERFPLGFSAGRASKTISRGCLFWTTAF
jgi:NTP pyrophosphatase (non-canonical NTP hydrolase)